MDTPTREVFGNIAPWMQWLFYGAIFLSLGALGWRVAGRVRLWRKGQSSGFERDWRVWLRRLILYALGQKKVHEKSLGALIHLLLYSGFAVLAVGTTLLLISYAGPLDFHSGWYYLFYELTTDVFGVAFCLGCLLALYRRAIRRPASLGHNALDWLLLGLLLTIGSTGFLLEALRLQYTEVDPNQARWSIAGWGLAATLLGRIDPGTAQSLHLAAWWVHAVLVALFFFCIPVTRFLHVITGPINIASRPSRPMGALEPLTIEEVEKTGRVGVGEIGHFSQQQLLSLDACMECGRCDEVCPAQASGKPLSPKSVVIDLRTLMSAGVGASRTEDPLDDSGNGGAHALHGRTIQAETLWSCTMCQACVEECPVLIGHVDLIGDMRRHLVGEGRISGPPAAALRHLGGQSNPHGQANAERAAWAGDLDVPTVESNPDFEYLLWVGCAASFDPRAQKVARATTQLLMEAGVNFAILGKEERCTGDPARRLGDEFLFQEQAQTNIQTLDARSVEKIVTPCPHCYNAIKNEYPQFGGRYQVEHHAQLLARLIDAGQLDPGPHSEEPIALHDPCYLARANGEVEAQRKVIGASQRRNSFCEMPRHGEKTFCCGAGGGRTWFDETPEQRVSHLRAREAVATGAKTLATACPFCLNMMSDGMAAVEGGQDVKVLDVSEVLINARRATQSA